MLLNVSEELGNDDFASAPQDPVLGEKAAAADGQDHAVRKPERLFGGQCCFQHLKN